MLDYLNFVYDSGYVVHNGYIFDASGGIIDYLPDLFPNSGPPISSVYSGPGNVTYSYNASLIH